MSYDKVNGDEGSRTLKRLTAGRSHDYKKGFQKGAIWALDEFQRRMEQK